jgi:CcmD family protein
VQTWTWTPRLFAQPQPSATASAPTDPSQRATEFRPVEPGRGELQSGEKLLVEAYAAIWLVLFVMLLLGWRRQRKIDQRVSDLEAAIARARREDSPSRSE